ncbi:LysR family transcriptional regulator [Aeromicrobium sp. CF3.5]|uniref:LysR family transcriptional regulator n=1 Tax=Aeromicrobium sp. CF3.5 TaxID=3373078 RepID=UPI003EE6DC0D
MELELRHLKVVSTIAAAGSITKAAAELGVAQPALTAQLGRIERTLGGSLFDRDHRGVRATALGELVIARAGLLLPAMSGLLEEANRFSDGLRDPGRRMERLSLGSSTSALLAPLIQRLSTQYPAMTVATTASWSADDVAAMLGDRRIDAAVVGVCAGSRPPGGSDLVWRTFAIDPVFVLLPEDHALAGRTEVTLADFSGSEWAATPGDGCFRDCFAAACASEGFTPSSLFVTDAASCMELVASGTAVALCQAVRVLRGFVTVPLVGAPLTWRHMVGWRPDSAAAEFGDRLTACVGEAHQDLVERSTVYSTWLRDHSTFGVQPGHRTG